MTSTSHRSASQGGARGRSGAGLFAAIVCAAGFNVHARAGELIDLRMDLSTFLSTTPGNWNNISNLTGVTSNLIDFNTGNGTGVSLTGSVNWQNFFGDDAGAFPNQDWLIQPATVDGAGLQTNLSGTFTLSGLPDGIYTVEVVSARTTFGYLNTFTVNGELADRTFLGTPVVTPWNSTTDGLEPGNWLIWDNVVPDDGEIVIQDVAGPGTLGILNAMRVVQIPAPGTAVVLVVTGLACGRRRR